ncbi:MAG: hypothetical protein A2W00_06905 [Candidatus Eisenbacteria bacterium RBG_16_71_46]|nr:MAG: hypothetical protein A2W00_06905 [Candidatus Eisenbacteria bacterium RBG_16_71_46]
MNRRRALGIAACCSWLAATGCTSLREIPRGEYAALPERRDVRLETKTGLVYEFDYARFDGDTLTGFRRQDLEGVPDFYASQPFPLDDVSRLSARRLDWYRTGMIGGGVAAVVVAAALRSATKNGSSDDTSGGGGPRIP